MALISGTGSPGGQYRQEIRAIGKAIVIDIRDAIVRIKARSPLIQKDQDVIDIGHSIEIEVRRAGGLFADIREAVASQINPGAIDVLEFAIGITIVTEDGITHLDGSEIL